MPHHLAEARGGNLQLIPPPLPPFFKKTSPGGSKGRGLFAWFKSRVGPLS